jgi:hypothetical protein
MFSLCHATARPGQWKDCYDAWWSACDNPEAVEYILAIDERWGFNRKNPPAVNERTNLLWCSGKRGSTTAWNSAAELSTGTILIMVADDFRPAPHWDTELLKAIPDPSAEFVVEVSSGKLPDAARLMVLYILSRKRYESLGYVLNPGYISVYADNEFGDQARKEGVVIDARHLMFRHHHPYYGDSLFPRDAVYDAGNTPEAAAQGLALYLRRKAAGFPRIPKPQKSLEPPKVSVITPTISGRREMLLEARRSVFRQTFPSIEHLCEIDTDGIGAGFMRNQIAKRAKGEWLVFLDDDDLLDPQFVELHLEHAEATGADLVYSICRLPADYVWWKPRVEEFDEAELRREGGNYIPVTVLLRRSAFEKAGGFDVSGPLDDWNLWIALLDSGAKFAFLPCVCWTYRVHGLNWLQMEQEIRKLQQENQK